MSAAPGRRAFLHSLLGAAVGLPALGRAAFAAGSPVVTTRLSDTLAVIAGAGGNVLAASAPDGLLLVNGGSRAQSGALLAELAAQFAGKPVKTLINTDWHPDHTGSNEALRKAGATVIAHEFTKQYLSAAHRDWQETLHAPLPKQALPTKTLYNSETLMFGGETVDYGQLGQAHTDGDLYVYLRNQNVLAAGDMLASGAYPLADHTTGGWLGGMVTATKTILDMTNAQTRYVPGTGPVLARADVEAQHQMLLTLRDRIGKMMRQGMGADDMLAAGITKEYDARWGSPTQFVNASYQGMWLHVRELGGVV
jgi:glyoxylase-like metal-dependent hydrolase (beta-lactamase superfamily II)